MFSEAASRLAKLTMDSSGPSDAVTVVHSIARFVGIHVTSSPVRLGRGVASSAWRVDSESGSFVVRLRRSTSPLPCTYLSESAILRQLRSGGWPVPIPLGTSYDFADTDPVDVAWSVTSMVPGRSIGNRSITDPVAEGLGEFLAGLHGLPSANYGPLAQSPAEFSGLSASPLRGLQLRWRSGQAWPIDSSALLGHPIAELLPAAASTLGAQESHILDLLFLGVPSIVHSDLHQDHIFVKDGALSGVIDFGGALIASPAWDFAALAVFLDWQSADRVARGYARWNSAPLSASEITAAALVLALYRFSVEWTFDRESAEVKRLLRFIDETIRERVLD